MAKYKVLSTKKLDPSLVQKAGEKNIEITEQEFISVKPVYDTGQVEQKLFDLITADVNHVVFTSQNAVFMLDEIMSAGGRGWAIAWWIFCLSGKTKEALALQSNYVPWRILGIAENSTSLAQIIIQKGIKEIIFVCGNQRREELPSQLRQAGVTVHELIVYETVETPVINEQDFDAILFFSPSAVHSYFSMNQLKKESVCFAIGQTTARSIADVTDNKIIVSELPSQEKMLEAVHFYFENSNCYD